MQARAPATDRRQEILTALEGLVAEYLALEPPADPDRLPLSVPLFGAEEVMASLEVLLSRNVTMGARVREFEAAFADYIGSRHALMLNSGSSANLLALAVLASERVEGGLRPGDEVIVPAVTWSTTVAPVLQMGCVPVFVDIDPDTLNLRPGDLEQALTERTRAIFVVHLLGNPVAMNELMGFAERHDLWVVEDTCESLGSTYAGRRVGSFGDAGTFSFYFSHHITTIEGGMLVTDSGELADLGRSMRAHGWTRDVRAREQLEAANPSIDPRFLFVNTGYNLRATEVQAAFGLVQLGRLEELNAGRRRNARALTEALEPVRDRLRVVTEQPGGESTWFGFSVLLDDADTRDALSAHLEARGIETRPIVAGNLALQPAFRDAPHRTVGDLPHATAVGRNGLFVGSHPDLDDARRARLVEAFLSFFEAA